MARDSVSATTSKVVHTTLKSAIGSMEEQVVFLVFMTTKDLMT
jgi:hypothetical protein